MSQAITDKIRWTSADVALLATDEWKRYEIIDGELFVTRAPHIGHQDTIGRIYAQLLRWSTQTGLGRPLITPGIIFSDADNVIPDLVWLSQERLAMIVDDEGHLTAAPELVIEVLSSGATHERRDREAKLKLYSAQGVEEYWIVDWRRREVAVFRREGAQLLWVKVLLGVDAMRSPLLPGFDCVVESFFGD
jgi:Uma2 family endonuclease